MAKAVNEFMLLGTAIRVQNHMHLIRQSHAVRLGCCVFSNDSKLKSLTFIPSFFQPKEVNCS